MQQQDNDNVIYLYADRYHHFLDKSGRELTLNKIKEQRFSIIRMNASSACYPLAETVWPDTKIQICSPYFWEGRHRKDLFAFIEKLNTPSSLGGFHTLTEDELSIYKARFYIDIRNPNNNIDFIMLCRVPDSAIDTITETRLYRLLKFCSHINSTDMAKMILMILDPRWHTTYNGDSKLYKIFHAYKNKFKEKGIYHPRFRLALSAWKTSVETVLQKILATKTDVNLSCREFLISEWIRLTKSTSNIEFADFKVTVQFLNYIYYTWQDLIHQHISDGVIDPAVAFTTSEGYGEWKNWKKAVLQST